MQILFNIYQIHATGAFRGVFSNSKVENLKFKIDYLHWEKMLLNQKHFFLKACILLIHENILQEPINMLLIL